MKKTKLSCSLFVWACLINSPSIAAEIETNAALMQAMDKVTGRVNEIIVPVKSKITFGDFSLVLRACKKRPAEETPENFAFIDVADKSFGADEYNIFRGWVVSSTPGISAIEHPIYDVWLLECIDKEVTAELLTDEELAKRDALPTKQVFASKEEPKEKTETSDTKTVADETEKVIHIKEFIAEDRDIEKNIKEMPAYITDTTESYVSDIEEGEEPENLLLFTKMQEADNEKKKEKSENLLSNEDDELSEAIEAEIRNLQR